MGPEQIGVAAGLATSVSWVASAIAFTAAARRLGAVGVNAARLLFAVVMLGVTHRVLFGTYWPETGHAQLAYLALSGLVGLTICDQCLFSAFLDAGPRLVLLVMTTSPLFALLFGGLVLGERVGLLALLAVLVTLAGVAWVVGERRTGGRPRAPSWRRGVLLAVAASALQAAGSMLSKRGIGHGVVPPERYLDPQAATLVRMTFGALGMIPIVLWSRRRAGRRAPPIEGRVARGLMLAAVGAVFGPFLGVWASLVAFDRLDIGIAQTLCSLSPVLILPAIPWLEGERVSARAVLGAIVAVAGSALLVATL